MPARRFPSRIRKPWPALPMHPPFVLPEDQAALARSPKKASSLQLHLLPGPWYGPIATTASVVVLLTNPGHHEGQDEADLTDPEFSSASRQQLSGRSRFPWHLPRWRHTAAGDYWWRCLRMLVADVGERAVSRHLAVAQLVPYHAKSDPGIGAGILPSQPYTGVLVERAIGRGALIVAWRGRKGWTSLVPSLDEVDLVSPRVNRTEPILKPGRNIDDAAYGRIVAALAG